MDQDQTAAALERIRSEIETQELSADRHADAAEAEADPIKRRQHEHRSTLHELFIDWLSAIRLNSGAAAGHPEWLPGQLTRLSELFRTQAAAADTETVEGQVEQELMTAFRATLADIASGTSQHQTDQ